MSIIFGIFLILHGLIHLLYFGQAGQFFELKPGFDWPAGSWVFSNFIEASTSRYLACILLVVAGLGFVAGGIGFLATQPWSRTVVIASAIFSVVVFILLWNGTAHNLDGQGLVGVLIDLAILAVVLLARWPKLITS